MRIPNPEQMERWENISKKREGRGKQYIYLQE
jgi:hypothetical protein